MTIHEPDTISVPRRLLEELASYLETSDEPAIVVPGNGRWTRTDLRRLKEELTAYRGALAALDLAAKRSGEVISLDEIEASCDIPRKQISSDLGAMSKAARRLFGEKKWPMRAMQASTGMNYLMQPDIAAWWSA